MARGHELAFPAKEGGVVDGEEHVHRRLIDRDAWQRLWVLQVHQCVTYLKSLNAYHGAYLTGLHFLNRHAAKAFKYVQLLDFYFLDAAIALAQCHVGAFL